MTTAFAQTSSLHKIRIAVYSDTGADPKAHIYQVLASQPDMLVADIDGRGLANGRLKNFDLLLVPGGKGKLEGLSMLSAGRDEVRSFVEHGGLYIGTGAGCFLATTTQPEYIGILPMAVVKRQAEPRDQANLSITFSAMGKSVFQVQKKQTSVSFHRGPVLNLSQDSPRGNVTPLATFHDIGPGGKPGKLNKYPAIVYAQYAKGLIVGIATNHGAVDGLDELLPNVVHWLYDHRTEGESANSSQN